MQRPCGNLLLPKAGCALLFLLLSASAGSAVDAPAPGSVSAGAALRKLSIPIRDSTGASRERAVLLWHPTSDPPRSFEYFLQLGCVAPNGAMAPGRHPLVLFSHGYLGSADQVVFLTEALARAGYIVAAVNHADSMKERRAGQRPAPPRFADAQSWDDRKFRDRREDLVALLDHLLAENAKPSSFLSGHVDASAIGLMGHSLGGYTALGLTGGWPDWRDTRFRAALLLSPFSQPFLGRLAEGQVRVPVMIQGGTLDFPITPLLPPIYEKLPAPKYFLVLQQQTHFAWTNLVTLGRSTTECLESPGPAKLIADYSVAFFDRTLRGREVPFLRTANEALESFRFQEN